jgi:hypothetical protein
MSITNQPNIILFILLGINIALSSWIIPFYIGARREIGYAKSMAACIFLSPLIGFIISIRSKEIKKAKLNHYPLAATISFSLVLLCHYSLTLKGGTIFLAFEDPDSGSVTFYFILLAIFISLVFNHLSKRHSLGEALFLLFFPNLYLIYIAIVGKEENAINYDNQKYLQAKIQIVEDLYNNEVIDSDERIAKINALNNDYNNDVIEDRADQIEKSFKKSDLYQNLNKALKQGILSQDEYEQKLILLREKFNRQHKD